MYILTQLRPILYVLGVVLLFLAGTMCIPLLVDVLDGDQNWQAFLFSSLATAFFGGVLVQMNKDKSFDLTVRQTFLMTTILWIVIGIFGAVPLHFSLPTLSITDAYFESMSGITTTGATVLTGLDDMPRSVLLWRSILQWFGGLGVVVMAISVLPFLKVGGMQLFQSEFSENDKVLPRTAALAVDLLLVYGLLTLLCAFCYGLAGMSAFDAICHAMTTLATGGFSTSDQSVGHFQQADIEVVSTVFMILAAFPFVMYVQMLGGKFKPLFRNEQVIGFVGVLFLAIMLMVIYLVEHLDWTYVSALRYAAFNVTSIITGTGYATTDFGLWGPFAMIFFLLVGLIGGCAGSATCGIKVFRFQILHEIAKTQMKRLFYPHGVFKPVYNGQVVPNEAVGSVLGFFFIFIMAYGIIALCLAMTGLDFITAISGAVATLANIGPALGDVIGPAGTYQTLPDASKWIMVFAMLLGRLELFTVLVLFLPQFWQK